ncbi:MAG: peptidase U32 family protein [Bdellovibrionota bacterium]
MNKKNKLQIVAPAGDLLRFKIACIYGADNIYFSGQKYGLRAAANNLCDEEIIEACTFAKKYNAKPITTVNAIMHDKDLAGITNYLKFLDECKVYAVIIADPGLIQIIKKNTNLKIHISTQTSLLNSYTAKMWKSLGADRVVLAREITLKEAGKIGKDNKIETEVFGHGAMCMSYSGKCGLSTYLSKRDANRGGCIQACRFSYQCQNKYQNDKNQNDKNQSDKNQKNLLENKHPFSSKDLCSIKHIEKFFENNISALKIEGRMKSPFYVATTVKNYRLAIDNYLNGTLTSALLNKLSKNLTLIPHRDYFDGSLIKLAGENGVYPDNLPTQENAKAIFIGIVLYISDDFIAIKNFQPLNKKDKIKILSSTSLDDTKLTLNKFYDITKNLLTSVRQEQVVLIPKSEKLKNVKQYEILYKEI